MFDYRKLFLFLILLSSLSFIFSEGVGDYAYILREDSHSIYPETIYPNSEVSLNVTLQNISQISDAQNVILKLVTSNSNILPLKISDSLDIIKFNQSGTLVVRFKINENTPGGYYTIPYQVEYSRDGQKHKIDSQVSINVSNYSKLNVVINEYPKQNVYLNDLINIKGLIKNEGNSTLTGINLNLEYVGKIIPLSATSLFIGDVFVGSQKAFDFNIIIPNAAEPGIYDLNIVAEDVSGNLDSEKVSFIVEDMPVIIISSVDKSIEGDKTILAQGDTFSLSVQIENISKSKAKSVSMKILNLKELGFEGTDLAYVGSVDAADSGAGVFDLIVLPNSKAENKYIKLEIIYTDEYGVDRTINKEVNLLVSKAKSSGIFTTIVILLLIGAGIGYYLYKRKKRANKIKSL